jgi:hypothetical protein
MGSRLVVGTGRFHTYSLDGERVPSVTGIIGKAIGKPGLLKWSAREAALWAAANVESLPVMGEASWIREASAASDRVRDASAAAGTLVHSIAERLIFGEPVESYDPDTKEPYPDDVIRMGEQVARFMDAWDIGPDTALVECAVFHEELRYAGKFDLCAMMRRNEYWMIDYKTGASGVWPETALQLTAYSRATHVQIGDRDMTMRPIARGAALWVRPDGWELVPVRIDEEMWRAFRHAIEVAKWAGLRREDLIGAALPLPERIA